jgi:hypothetical protein
MLSNDRAHVDPNNVPLASLVAKEEHVDVNFIRNNNFKNSAYRNNFASNNYMSYPSTNGNDYGNSFGNSSNNTREVPSELEVMLKDFIGKGQITLGRSLLKLLGTIIDVGKGTIRFISPPCNNHVFPKVKSKGMRGRRKAPVDPNASSLDIT